MSEELFKKLGREKTISLILSNEFDLGSYVSTLRTTSAMNQELIRLKTGIDLVLERVEAEMSIHAEDYLESLENLLEAKGEVLRLKEIVGELKAATGKLKGNICDPYELVKRETLFQRNAYKILSLLRKSQKLWSIVSLMEEDAKLLEEKKFTSNLSDSSLLSIFQSSTMRVGDAEKLLEENEEILKLDHGRMLQGKVLRIRTTMIELADAVLSQGLISFSQAMIGASLQTLSNLGRIERTLEKVLKSELADVGGDFNELLTREYGSDSQVWEVLEEFFTKMLASFVKMKYLSRVIEKKIDVRTGVPFVEVFKSLVPGQDVFDRFLHDLLSSMRTRESEAVNRKKPIAVVLRNSYTRLVKYVKSFSHRFAMSVYVDVSMSELPTLTQAVIGAFQASYASHVSSLQIRAVNSVPPLFVSRRQFRATNVSSFAQLLIQEIESARVDHNLMEEVMSACLEKALHLFVLKAKAMHVETTTPLDLLPNADWETIQQMNLEILLGMKILHVELAEKVEEIIKNTRTMYQGDEDLNARLIAKLTASLQPLEETYKAALVPFFQVINSSFKKRISEIHTPKGRTLVSETDVHGNCSLYLLRVHSLSQKLNENLFKKVRPPFDELAEGVSRVVDHLVSIFILGASMVQCRTEGDGLQLVNDALEVQKIASSLLKNDFREIGKKDSQNSSLQELQQFIQLLLFEVGDEFLAENYTIDSHIVVHALFSKLRSSAAILPWQRKEIGNGSPREYSSWIASNNNAAIIKNLRETVDISKQRVSKFFASIDDSEPTDSSLDSAADMKLISLIESFLEST